MWEWRSATGYILHVKISPDEEYSALFLKELLHILLHWSSILGEEFH